MKISTLSLRKYATICCIFLLTSLSFSQTPDYEVQHIQDDVANAATTNTGITPVSLNNAVALANNNRKSNAGQNGSSSNLNGDDLAGARQLTNTSTLTYYRETGSSANDMRFNTSIWEYVGAPGGDNEMIVRGRYAVNLNGTTNSVTQALSGVVNANNCIPFITGIMNNTTNDDADSGTAIAYLQNLTTLRVLKGSNGNDVTVYITVVEYTGSNWTVLHGDSGNVSNDTGSFTLRNGSDGTGTATSVSSWSDAIIFSHHIGDTGTNGTNDAIADNWPIMQPGSNDQTIDWNFDTDHVSAGTNRHFAHVLTNTGLNVTRYQNTSDAASETTVNIASAGLTDVNQALIIGSSISSGTGAAYGRGWRNYYFNSTTQAAHWSHRSGNTMSHEIQIVDLVGLTTTISGPEINIQGNTVTIADGDTTPALADDTDFGSIDISGVTQVNTFTIQNIGTTTLNLTDAFPYVIISGTHAGDFTVTSTPSNTIGAGGSTTFDITFDPSAIGLRTATITIANNDTNENLYNFDIQGTGESVCGIPVSSFPYNEGFESGLGDWTQDTGDDRNWTRVNLGTPSGSTGPSSANEGDWYMFTEGSGTNINQTFNLESPCFDLTSETAAIFSFYYHMYGSDMGDLFVDISTNGGVSYNVTPLWSQLGQVQTSSAQAWELTNIDLSAYLGQTIKLRFRGETGNDYRSDMAIDNILLATTISPEINIQGNAITIIDGDITPAVADDTDFGAVGTGTGTKVNTFTIQNIGNAPLSVGTITIGGTNAADFTLTASPSATVALSANTTFDITFSPSADGLRTATLSIVNDDSNENPYNFNIQGTGVVPQTEINIQGNATTIVDGDTTPTLADDTGFGSVNVVTGTNVNTFTIQNTGTTALTVGSISITGTNAADFILTSAPAASVAASGSTTFDITFDPNAAGLRTASISIVNNDSDENPYDFNIQGSAIAGLPSYTAYYEDFDQTNGGWSNTTNTNDSWVWDNSFPRNELGEGSFWRNNNFNNYVDNTNIILQSPVIDLSGVYNLQLSLDVKCKTIDNRDGMIIQYSIAGGSWTTLGVSGDGMNWYNSNTSVFGFDAWNGNTHTAAPSFDPHNQFVNARIDLPDALFTNQSNVRFRMQFRSDGSGVDDGVAFDNFRIEADPIASLAEASVAPADVTSNLRLWLKMNEGVSATDGTPLTSWEDQAFATTLDKEDASAASSIAPTYRDNSTRNINFNPVADFDHNNVEYMNGKGGFFSQDYYVVFHSDDEIDTSTGSFSPGRQFALGGRFSDESFHEDPTGLGLGSVSSRYSNEILAHTISSYGSGGASDPESYGRAFTTTTYSYQNHPTIVNVKSNTAGTLSEIYKNGKRVDNTAGISGDGSELSFYEFNNLSYLIGTGRSGIAGRTSSQMNGMIAEVISYTSPNSALNQQKIQSYLALKYGVTLQSSSTGYAHSNHRQNDVDYIDSQGTVIWDTSVNTTYNYDIAGIGRDDASILNQKQSKSQNIESDGTDVYGPTLTSGFLTMGLNDIYDTNNQHVASDPTSLNDGEFLVWGNNGADVNLAASVVSVNMSAGISPALSTDVSFTAMQRVWKVVESGGDIPSVKVRLPQNALRNITPPGNFYMFISSTGVFDPTADYRIMMPDGNGNLETDYDFDNTKYITFGYAPQVIVERSVYFDGVQDYIDMEDVLDLNSSGFTISAWIKRDAADSGRKSIVSKRDVSYNTGYDFIVLGDNKIQMTWKNPSNQSLTSSTSIPDNEWHHVAAIYDGTRLYLYIDGVNDIAENRTAPIDSDNSFYIAAAAKASPRQYFRGNIDEVRVWDTGLTEDQLRFVMNQEIEENAAFVSGKALPTTISKNDIGSIPWSDLAGYYPMSVYTYTNTDDASGNSNQGALRNLDTVDRQSAPLPYQTSQNGTSWDTAGTWENGSVQTIPGSSSIVDSNITVDWNIVNVGHTINMENSLLPLVNDDNRTVLSLVIQDTPSYTNPLDPEQDKPAFYGDLTIDGNNADATSGNGITVSHYLKLDGKIDLEGQSQLIQTTDSDLDPTSSGSLEKDQQGSADVFTYNYWSSPIGEINATTNNNSYAVSDIMYDGVNPINFISSGYNGSDGAIISIADYWIWKFANQPDDDYSAWQHVRQNGTLLTGEGFTMKGPGSGTVVDQQNYVFLGKPNNGDVNLTLNAGNDYLVGNPYPSAIDANQFITDNGPNITGAGANPLISGTLYFWEHWGGGSHNLSDYQGGYATYNFSGGVGAPSLGTNDPDVGTGGTPTKLPARYIPVSQGFFVVGESTGTINFNNGQRAFKKESLGTSTFLRTDDTNNNGDLDDRMKFRIGFNSINTIHRQLLLTIDESTTTGFDWAFDAKIYDNQMDDLFWMIDDEMYTIQGSNEVEPESVYPLGLKTKDDGLNTITIDRLESVPDSIEIYIHDIENDTYHNLREGDFQFFLPAGEYFDRYELTFRDANIDPLSIDDTELNTLDVFYNNETESITVLNPNLVDVTSIELYNIIGQNITTIENISELDYSEYQVKNLSTGTYIIKINTLSGLLSKKVLVK